MATPPFGWRIVAFLSLFLLAACAAPPKRALDPAARNADARDAIVVVPQGEIRAIIKPSNAGMATGGGLIGALIDVSINQIRTNSAEDEVRPIRDALAGYDFDRRALESARAAAAQIDWLHIRNFVFTKDASKDQILAHFDQSNVDQFLVASYTYTFSPDFKQLSIALRAGLYPKNPPQGVQPDQRLARGNELYEQEFVVLVDVPRSPMTSMQTRLSGQQTTRKRRARRSIAVSPKFTNSWCEACRSRRTRQRHSKAALTRRFRTGMARLSSAARAAH